MLVCIYVCKHVCVSMCAYVCVHARVGCVMCVCCAYIALVEHECMPPR